MAYLCAPTVGANFKTVQTSTAVTVSVVIGVVIIAIVIALMFYWASRKRQIHRTETTPTTVHGMTTPVAVVVVEAPNSVSMARETGIHSAIIIDAEMVMPSASSAADCVNHPVATAQYQTKTLDPPVAIVTAF